MQRRPTCTMDFVQATLLWLGVIAAALYVIWRPR